MFKIESYITPLLMGYLDKYVKLRPEDFQLSLWGGDAVLYNLDLRLDIIEKAVQLPIVFQSGHIHELRLHVPWTKLGSDPVVVTINTIECILKLRDTAYKGRGSRASSETPRKPSQKQKVRKQENVDLPPGYLQSLMNKIVNNVSIIVNNLIVKFVEDDIVLSLNIKSAECYSVDKDWNRAFTEVYAPDFVLRRTINFCDVTVCLDKRDASGKIENYQDPVVYRCSIASRLYTKYENMHSKYPMETKLNIYCERLDLSLTDTQLPMLIRLIELCLALYYGTLEFKVEPTDEPDQQSVERGSKTESSVGEPPPEEMEEDQQSWTSWAWSYVPQILPEEEEEELQLTPPKKPAPLIFSLGLYAYKMTLKFKLTEYLREKAHYGPRKIAFKPFLYLESDGISMDMLMQGLTFFDVQFGITNLAVYSQGPCICGAEGEENSRNNVLLSGGDNLLGKTTSNYICQSLFDQQSPENLGIPISKILDFDEHRQVYTEQYGMQKFGFFWMDMLYSMVKPEESTNTSSKSSVSSQDESTVFIRENSLSRFVIGQSHLNVSSTTVHRVQKLIDAAYKYEYEPYSKPQKERVDEGRPHPTEEQMKSLEDYIPTRTYHLTLLQPVISVLSAEHTHCDIAKKSYRSSQHKIKPQQVPVLHPLFGVQITSQRFDLQVTSPMYPRRLVQLVSMIAGPSSNLLHHCHSHTQMKMFGFQVGVTKVDSVGARSPVVTVIPPTSGAMYTRKLLLTMYWTNSYLSKLERVYELPQISITVSKPALHVVMAVVSSWKQNNPKPADILATSLLDDVFPAHDVGVKHAILEVTLSGFEMKTCRNDMVTACSATLSSIHTVLYRYDGQKTSVIPIFSCPCDTEGMHSTDWLISDNSSTVEEVKNDCLMLTYQLPRKYDQVLAPTMVLVNIEGIAVCFSPALQTWFNYKPETRLVQSKEPKIELDLELAKMASPLQTNISQVSVPSSGSKRQTLSLTRSPTTGQQSTLPTGNQDSKPPDNQEVSGMGEKLANIFPLIRVLQVQVEMKKACVFIPKQHIEPKEPSMNIIGNFQTLARSRSLSDTLVVCLPRVVIQSAAIKPLTTIPEIPVTSVEGSLVGDKIPWNVSLQSCCVYTVHSAPTLKALQLMKPATVSCTVGVSYKYTPPTSDTISALGLCLHTDMRLVTLSTSMEQVKLLVDVSNSAISTCKQAVDFLDELSSSLATEDKLSKPMSEPFCNQNQGANVHPYTASAASVSHSDIPYTQTSGDITSLDTPSKELEILEIGGEGVKLSLWLQWTLPKCEMRLYLQGKQGETKLSALLEDIMLSVDVQDVYSKLKLNMGAVGVSHFQRQSGTAQWQKGAHEGILMTCRDTFTHDTHIVSSRLWSGDHGSASMMMFPGNQPQRETPHGFLSLTFTRALRKNVKKRLQKLNIEVTNIDTMSGGDITNQFYFNKYVSEICLNMAPCDFILCLEPVTSILYSLSQLDLPRTPKLGNRPPPVEEPEVYVPVLNTSYLPLLYADVSNVRIFIPGGETDNKTNGDNIITTMENDMFLLQIQSMSVIPHADNPLPRYAIDKDLYQRALHLGITSESGAALSDTQFQVDLKGLSFTSGCWSDFLRHCNEKQTGSVVTPVTQIPAVEWNALTLRDEHEETQLFPILSPCDLKLILAPAMVNYTPVLGSNHLKASLVCGYGLEFNVTSDLDLHVSTNQIHLMHCKVIESLKKLKLGVDHNDDSHEENSSVQDSGLGSEVSTVTVQRSTAKPEVKDQSGGGSKKTLTPVDLLLTAGRISCTLYTHKKVETEIRPETEKHHFSKKKKKHTKQDIEWRVDRHFDDNPDLDQSDAAHLEDSYLMHMYQMKSCAETVIPAGTTCLEPFLFLYVTQPHTVLTCQLDHQKFETSCYDILVKGAGRSTLIPVSDVKLLPDCSDFTEYWLETRPGQPHPSTGIPASLYTLNVVDFLTKPGKVTLKLERPVRMNVSFPKIRQIEQFCKTLLPWQQKKSERTKSSAKTSSDGPGTVSLLSNIDSIDIQTEQVVFAMETKPCDKKPEISASFSNFKGHADILHNNNGEIDSILLGTYLRDLLVKTVFEGRSLSMIGPCSIKADGTYTSISQDDVHFLSQYTVTIATGLVTVHFGQEHALCLKMIADHCIEFYKSMLPESRTTEEPVSKTAKQTSGGKTVPDDFVAHMSRDDLRSGEFQYVMDRDGVDVVPRPGEIVFCNRDREGNSSMTWSYREPRVISALSSTPIPFNTSGQEKRVECVLQYWEALVQQFIDFSDIDLLENEVTEVSLPDVRAASEQELVAAQIWRVMIRNNNEEMLFQPASLAASVKVDSCFVPSLIPTIQVGLTMESAQIHLSNHVHCLGTETPTKLCPFLMSGCYQPTGEFAVISLDNVLVAGSQWHRQQARNQLQFSSQFTVDMLEYKTLTMEKVISQFELTGNCNLQNIPKSPVLDIDLSCEPVTVRVGQGVMHNLECSIKAWNQILNDEPSDLEEIIFCHYVICNDTQQPIRFGQVGTDENLVLQSREMHQYGWRSHKMRQELHICLDGPVWKWCDAVDVNKPGTVVRNVSSIDQQYTLVITVKRLSNIQHQIIIAGLVTVSNRLSLHMEVKVITMETEQQAVAGAENIIPSYVLEPQKIQGIKFRPWGQNGPWSKEVYLSESSMKENNLVKITSGSKIFHIWCRVIVHPVQNHKQTFIVMCPLYTVRSHLPYPLYINIDTSKLNLHEQIEAPGRGRDIQLQCPGGDVHQALTFQFSASSGKSSTSVTLSTGLIDQLQRSTVTDFDPSTLNQHWRKDTWFEWPYTNSVKLEENTPRPDLYNISLPEDTRNQPTIDLNVNLSELWPGFQTLLVDVTPSFMISNQCDLDLVFMGNEDVTYDIHRGQTICPPKLENSFHVGVKFGDTVHMSEPVPVSDEEVEEQRYRNDLGQTLYIDTYINMPIYSDFQGQPKVYFLTISSTVKNRIRVISIREQFVITNLTKYTLQACVFAVPTWSSKVNIPVDFSFNISSHLGCPKDRSDLHPLTFLPLQYVPQLKKKYDLDQKTDVVNYLVLKCAEKVQTETKDSVNAKGSQAEAFAEIPLAECKKDFGWTFPVRLIASENGCRMTTSLTVDRDSGIQQEALCITGLDKEGVTYVTIQVDSAPACFIQNYCSFPLYFGQTLLDVAMSGATFDTTVQEETELVNCLPFIPVNSAVYYTPSFLNRTFPQISDKLVIPKIHISGKLQTNSSGEISNVKWSNSIDLLVAADNFVSIPNVADVKVHVQQVAMVTHVTISPITKADVSAKEIRSRLKGKERTVVVESGLVAPVDAKIAQELKHALEIGASRNNEKHKNRTKKSVKTSVGLLVNQLSFIVQNESSTYTKGEIVRLTVEDLYLAAYPASDLVEQTGHQRNCVVFSVGDVQLDNQIQAQGNYDFPVVFVRQGAEITPYQSDHLQLSQLNILEKHAVLKSISTIHAQIVFGSVNGRSSVIESVECAMKPLSFYIDDTFIFRCIKEAEGFLPVPLSIPDPLPVDVLKLPAAVKSISRTLSCPITIGHLSIQPVSVMLSIHASLKLFIASDHTPLSFGKFEKTYLCTTSYQLVRALVMHYASGALFRAGAVVGSLEILGNPTGLVRSIGTGVADFFRMPYRGLTRGPGAFVVGVSQGTSSMVKNITTGMLKSVTDFASSVSRNMDRLSLDGSHIRRQEESRRHRPDGVGEGLKQGLTGLGISLLGAVAGLADQPIQSLIVTEESGQPSMSRTSTASGLVTGVGKGLVGIFTKPIGGAAEFVSQTGQGILHGTGLSKLPKPQMTPCVVNISLEPCGQVKYALKLFQTLPSNDILCCMEADHIEVTDKDVSVTLILTPEILFVVNNVEDSQQQSFSILELECGVTQGDGLTHGDKHILSIVWKDSQTFTEAQYGPSKTERVTAFVDSTSKYITTTSALMSGLTENNSDKLWKLPQRSSNMDFVQTATSDTDIAQGNKEKQLGSLIQGEQLSDTMSDSSVEAEYATLPQYDFKMSATNLAAFLAIFNITKHKLAGIGFAV